ncbi:uncharacterized protein BDW70DRAFT_105511 [Aspergillus foveolatus]|uniref:uncharacterized protein n=1 Tax=Aspergillus foveolatus TaxID=210207 RepID=UPI003CCD09E9
MNPFSASRLNNVGDSRSAAADAEVCHNHPTGHNPTPFEYLTASLTQYVQQTSAAGQTVTDEMLQKEARRIVFGDDDPWNQTPADNVEGSNCSRKGLNSASGLNLRLNPRPTQQMRNTVSIASVFLVRRSLDTSRNPSWRGLSGHGWHVHGLGMANS